MLEMDLKITSNTVLTCFLMQTMKCSITIDKLSLSSLSFSQINTFSFLWRGRISAHPPHLPAETPPVSPHHFFSLFHVQGYAPKFSSFLLNVMHKFPSFSQGNSSFSSTPTSSTSIYCCLLLLTSTLACQPPRSFQLPLPHRQGWGTGHF